MKGKIEYKGKVYRSFNYLCRCFRRERSSVEYRLEHGMTLEQALEDIDYRACAVRDYKGNIYPTVVEFAKAYGFSGTGYVYKLLQVMSFEQISEYRVKSRSYQSKLVAQEYGFNSLKELLKSIGLSRNTYQNRIMKGMPIKQALGLEN